MTDHVLEFNDSWPTLDRALGNPLSLRPRNELDRRRVRQKQLIARLREDMRQRAIDQARPAKEITWISTRIAALPIVKYAVELDETSTWYFKLQLGDGRRVNVQVDRENDAFVSIYRDGVCGDMGHGTLEQIVGDLQSITAWGR